MTEFSPRSVIVIFDVNFVILRDFLYHAIPEFKCAVFVRRKFNVVRPCTVRDNDIVIIAEDDGWEGEAQKIKILQWKKNEVALCKSRVVFFVFIRRVACKNV